MSTRRSLLILITTLLFFTGTFTTSAFARNQSAFLKAGVGAKAKAIGGVYEATVENPTAVYWNPAGLGSLHGRQEVVSKKRKKKKKKGKGEDDKDKKAKGKDDGKGKTEAQKLLDSLSNLNDEIPPLDDDDDLEAVETRKSFAIQATGAYNNFAADREVTFAGTAAYLWSFTLGAGWLSSREEGLQGTNSTGQSTGTFDYSANAYLLGFGMEQGNVRFGVSGKFIQETLPGRTYTGGGADIGVQTDILGSFIRLGVVLQDAFTMVPGDGRNEQVDRTLAFAVAINPPTVNNIYLMLGSKVNLSHSESSNFGMGVKYEFRHGSLSAGFNEFGPAAGFGLNITRYADLDFAISKDPLETDRSDIDVPDQLLTAVELTFKFE